jgi:hypothetical protein
LLDPKLIRSPQCVQIRDEGVNLTIGKAIAKSRHLLTKAELAIDNPFVNL